MTIPLQPPDTLRERLLTLLFGPHCKRCWLRVYPKDQNRHDKDCT